jgi:hypothetical protein
MDTRDDLMVFKSKGRQMVGYPDTLWYGADNFNICHHAEGIHAVIRYRPSVSKEYAGDRLSVELRDELPPSLNRKPRSQRPPCWRPGKNKISPFCKYSALMAALKFATKFNT